MTAHRALGARPRTADAPPGNRSGRRVRHGRTILVLDENFDLDNPHRHAEQEVVIPPPSVLPRFFQFVIGRKFFNPPKGVSVINHFASSAHHFNPGRATRTEAVDELVIHETQTSSVSHTIEVLRGKNASVHLIVAPDWRVTQHGDLLVRMGHAEPHNPRSVGIEVVNPYVASRLLRPWTETIAAPWSTRGYVLPTPKQAEVVAALINWLTRTKTGTLDIPRTWIGESADHMAMILVPGAGAAAPGIYAHTYFCPTKCGCKACRDDPGRNPCKCKHADGAWLVLYAWLRLEAGLTASNAYDRARDLGKEPFVRRVEGVPGRWVRLPPRHLPTSPSNDSCVTPRVSQQELQWESGEGCATVPIASTPTPGRFYTVKRGVDAKGLLDLAGRAYGVSPVAARLALARRINDHPDNARFLLSRLATPSFPRGRISFNPAFSSVIRAQAAARGAAPRGNAFATIYIPKRP